MTGDATLLRHEVTQGAAVLSRISISGRQKKPRRNGEFSAPPRARAFFPPFPPVRPGLISPEAAGLPPSAIGEPGRTPPWLGFPAGDGEVAPPLRLLLQEKEREGGAAERPCGGGVFRVSDAFAEDDQS